MFAEFEAEAHKVLVADTPERRFRREYHESRKSTQAPVAARQVLYRQPERTGVRDAALLKVARFIRLA